MSNMLALTHHSMPQPPQDLTMAVLGCGTMGIAILNGILTSLVEMQGPKPLQSGASTPSEEVPRSLPSRFIACVRTPETAKKVKSALWEHSSVLKVVRNDNLAAVQQSQVILLTCKPYMVKEILGAPGMAKALHGKLLISVCAGITVEQLEIALHGAVPSKDPEEDGRCRIETETLVTWIFKRVGDVVYLPARYMNASTALCGSGPAFYSLFLEAAIEGAVAMGTTGLIQSGEHPALLREKVCTPGGCTVSGVLVLEEERVRGTISKAVREASLVASQLGKNIQAANTAAPRNDIHQHYDE
ncbi:hypothetical protein TrVFT333_005497 [Trichoderma virens FT-333]|nr:hypothetical protein TrVFT333_005497 [Trichoderma virens FT-333]